MPANPKAASVRLKATGRAALIQIRHDMREGAQPPHVDRRRAGANSVLAAPPGIEEIYALAQRRFDAAQDRRRAGGLRPLRARPSSAAPAVAALITLGRDVQQRMAAMTEAEQDAAFKAGLDAAAGYLDAPVLWAAVHRDESAPHLHAGLCAVRGDGRAVTSATKAGGLPPSPFSPEPPQPQPPNTSELQTVLHRAMRPHLPGLERGHRKTSRLADGEPLEATKTQTHQMMKLRLGLGPAARAPEIRAAVKEKRETEKDAAAEIARLYRVRGDLLDELEALETPAGKLGARIAELEAKDGRTPREEKRLEIYRRRAAARAAAKAGLQKELDGLGKRIRDAQAAAAAAEKKSLDAARLLAEARRAAEKKAEAEAKAGTDRAELAVKAITGELARPAAENGVWLTAARWDSRRWRAEFADALDRPGPGAWPAAVWDGLRALAARVAEPLRRIAELTERLAKHEPAESAPADDGPSFGM